VTFAKSPDHDVVIGLDAVVTGYVGVYSAVGATDLVIDYKKPTPDATGMIAVPVAALLRGKAYTLKIEAVGPGGSTLSPASDVFSVMGAPGAPGQPKLTK
jgi:hypothetical protein